MFEKPGSSGQPSLPAAGAQQHEMLAARAVNVSSLEAPAQHAEPPGPSEPQTGGPATAATGARMAGIMELDAPLPISAPEQPAYLVGEPATALQMQQKGPPLPDRCGMVGCDAECECMQRR